MKKSPLIQHWRVLALLILSCVALHSFIPIPAWAFCMDSTGKVQLFDDRGDNWYDAYQIEWSQGEAACHGGSGLTNSPNVVLNPCDGPITFTAAGCDQGTYNCPDFEISGGECSTIPSANNVTYYITNAIESEAYNCTCQESIVVVPPTDPDPNASPQTVTITVSISGTDTISCSDCSGFTGSSDQFVTLSATATVTFKNAGCGCQSAGTTSSSLGSYQMDSTVPVQRECHFLG